MEIVSLNICAFAERKYKRVNDTFIIMMSIITILLEKERKLFLDISNCYLGHKRANSRLLLHLCVRVIGRGMEADAASAETIL